MTHKGWNSCFLAAFHHLLVPLIVRCNENNLSAPRLIYIGDEFHGVGTSTFPGTLASLTGSKEFTNLVVSNPKESHVRDQDGRV